MYDYNYDYNTTRSPLILKEYGRNVQKLMEQIKAIDDKTIRTQKAHALLKLMEMLDNQSDSLQKRWDDLFIMADYALDIDTLYPKPVKRDPSQRCYIRRAAMEDIRYKHYGRNMELLIKKITTLPTLKEQEEMLVELIKLMRRFSSTWNNDYISNEKIIEDIKRMLPNGAELNVEIVRMISEDDSNGQKSKPTTKGAAFHKKREKKTVKV